MTSTSRTRRAAIAAAWVAAGAVGATAVTGLAVATGAPTSGQAVRPAVVDAAGGVSGEAAATGGRAGIRRDVLHGRLTLRTATGTTTVDLQRGTLTAASATSVTVLSSDGFTATYAIEPSTKVRRDGRTVPAGDLATGDVVAVRAQAGTAVVVRALSPDAVARLKERRAARAGAGQGQGSPAATPSAVAS